MAESGTAVAASSNSGTGVRAATKRPFSVLDTRSSADGLTLDFESFVKNELKLNVDHVPVSQRPPSINDGKTGVCNYFLKGHCWKGNNCIYRHLTREQSERLISDNRTVVCKHWLRGLCKKDFNCEFLHEYNLDKMPKCQFYAKDGVCINGEDCFYMHINPEQRIRACPWYARGFCKHGAGCRSKHVRKTMCPYYQFGFCPDGPNCRKEHPRFELPRMGPAAAAPDASAAGGAPGGPLAVPMHQ
ncbi:RNA-binding component of cleavage and polyadenylation factor [Coemansia sp. RSA 552]|nr:RNA-binding component of cleavage and polyadenylation factor [Coemansia sp. RSA 552]